MKARLPLFALISLSASGSCAPQGPSPVKRAPLPKPDLVAALPKKSFDKGDRILLTLSIVNRTALPVTIFQGDFWPFHLVTILDKDGVEPPLTESGRRLRKLFRPGFGRDGTAIVVLKPGDAWATVGIDRAIDLAEIYQLAPGDYRVKVMYQEDADPKTAITSNWVSLRVN